MELYFRNTLFYLCLLFAVIAATGLPRGSAAAEEIVIGTSAPDSVHHHVGRAICRLVSRHTEELKCEAKATGGSLFNLSNIRNGAIEMGIVLSDWQYDAVHGTGQAKFMDGDFGNLRTLFSLYAEPFTVVARQDSGIAALADLKGKRVNIGNPGSEPWVAMNALMKSIGWTDSDFLLVQELPIAQQTLAFCHDRVQAMVYRVVHPEPAIKQAKEICGARLVPLEDAALDKFFAKYPRYSPLTVPAGTYAGSAKPTKTFGAVATLVGSQDVSEDVVYNVVKAIFENLDALKKVHPALRDLNIERMIKDGVSAPLHDGAKRYLREKGYM